MLTSILQMSLARSADLSENGLTSVPPKRLFSPSNSALAFPLSRAAGDLSACGSEFARTPEDTIRHGKWKSSCL